MISSPVAMVPLPASMPIVWANDGEFGRGGTLGAALEEDCDGGSWGSGTGRPLVEEGLGLFWGTGDLFDPPRKRALLLHRLASCFWIGIE